MSTEHDTPAENPQHESRSHPHDARVDPGTFACQLFEHLADVHRDAARIVVALEKIAEETTRIRAAMEDDRKEDGR